MAGAKQRQPDFKIWCLNVSIGVSALLTLALVVSAGHGVMVRRRPPPPPISPTPATATATALVEPAALPAPINVEILNGCGVRGAANAAASALRAVQGFDVVQIGNASGVRIARSVVLDRTGNGQAARVGKALGIDDVLFQRAADGRSLVTVIVGYDRGHWDEPLAGR